MARLDADLLTTAEVESLMRVCSRRAPTGVRNRLIITLAWRCGLRCSEILDLKLKDVNLTEATLKVQRGKGGRARVVGLDAGTIELIDAWLKMRKKHRISGDYLVPTLHGARLDASYLR